ncbi:hypothetical protein Q5752_001198 [Cryptotrichosporon argae]
MRATPPSAPGSLAQLRKDYADYADALSCVVTDATRGVWVRGTRAAAARLSAVCARVLDTRPLGTADFVAYTRDAAGVSASDSTAAANAVAVRLLREALSTHPNRIPFTDDDWVSYVAQCTLPADGAVDVAGKTPAELNDLTRCFDIADALRRRRAEHTAAGWVRPDGALSVELAAAQWAVQAERCVSMLEELGHAPVLLSGWDTFTLSNKSGGGTGSGFLSDEDLAD